MSDSSRSTSSEIGLTGAIFIVFLVLKLGGWGVVAAWSWWWVCSPLWIPLLVFLTGLLIYILGLLAIEAISGIRSLF